MTLVDFKRALRQIAPPAPISVPLQALWWAAKGEWEQAHALVQDDPGAQAARVHAYLHRVEGDLPNARYWYRQAGRAAATGPLEAEWDAIVTDLLGA